MIRLTDGIWLVGWLVGSSGCNVPGLGHGGGGGETETEDENSLTGVTGQKRGRREASASAGVQSSAACCWISGLTGPITGSVAGEAGAKQTSARLR